MCHETAILITSYCDNDRKQRMTDMLCWMARQSGHFICLSSHSIISPESQKYCNIAIYDADNSFQVNGQPPRNKTHGVAELTLIHNALVLLDSFGFKSVLKITYDNNPICNFGGLIERCKTKNKKLVSARWGIPESIGTMGFFVDIPFFCQTFSYSEVYRCECEIVEYAWYKSILEKGLLDQVFCYDHYGYFFDCGKVQFSDALDQYPL